MKANNIKNWILTSSLALSAAAAHAASGSGNGGGGIVCVDPLDRHHVYSVNLYDYWASENVVEPKLEITPVAEDADIDATLQSQFGRLGRIHSDLAEKLVSTYLNKIKPKFDQQIAEYYQDVFLRSTDPSYAPKKRFVLADPGESGRQEMPEDCSDFGHAEVEAEWKQIAIYNDGNEENMLLDVGAEEQASKRDQIGLRAHETIYKVLRDEMHVTDARLAQRLNALLASNATNELITDFLKKNLTGNLSATHYSQFLHDRIERDITEGPLYEGAENKLRRLLESDLYIVNGEGVRATLDEKLLVLAANKLESKPYPDGKRVDMNTAFLKLSMLISAAPTNMEFPHGDEFLKGLQRHGDEYLAKKALEHFSNCTFLDLPDPNGSPSQLAARKVGNDELVKTILEKTQCGSRDGSRTIADERIINLLIQKVDGKTQWFPDAARAIRDAQYLNRQDKPKDEHVLLKIVTAAVSDWASVSYNYSSGYRAVDTVISILSDLYLDQDGNPQKQHWDLTQQFENGDFMAAFHFAANTNSYYSRDLATFLMYLAGKLKKANLVSPLKEVTCQLSTAGNLFDKHFISESIQAPLTWKFGVAGVKLKFKQSVFKDSEFYASLRADANMGSKVSLGYYVMHVSRQNRWKPSNPQINGITQLERREIREVPQIEAILEVETTQKESGFFSPSELKRNEMSDDRSITLRCRFI